MIEYYIFCSCSFLSIPHFLFHFHSILPLFLLSFIVCIFIYLFFLLFFGNDYGIPFKNFKSPFSFTIDVVPCSRGKKLQVCKARPCHTYTTGPYPEFFLWGGGSFFPKLDLFFYKCHCIYRYIQDEMLENVILVILRRKIGYAVYALLPD